MQRRSFFKLTGLSVAAVALNSMPQSSLAKDTLKTELGTLPKLSESHPLLLNFNENAVGLAPSAEKAIMESIKTAFRYPDAQRAALVDALTEKFSLGADHFSIGNGSSENIQGIVQALINRAATAKKAIQLVVPAPTFNYAALYAKSSGVSVVEVPLTADLQFDIPAMQEKAKAFDGCSVFYLCNPNNPTATITPSKVLNEWITTADENQFFILDEAYAEFVTDENFESGISLVKKGQKNVAVTRTFSKFYALAGLRIGYAIAIPELIKEFESFMEIDNTNLAAAVAAKASLEDKAFAELSINSINQSRAIVTEALDELGLKYAPSQANFIFHEIKGSVKEYQENMKARHIVVGREFPPATGWNRLTLGTPEEMSIFVKVLREFREKGLV